MTNTDLSSQYCFIYSAPNSHPMSLTTITLWLKVTSLRVTICCVVLQLSQKINSLPDATNLIVHKLNFMRIVSSHEHYLTLNLPFTNLVASPMNNMSLTSLTTSLLQQPYTLTTELSDDFRQQHFLVGIILCDLVTSLSIRLVACVMCCHRKSSKSGCFILPKDPNFSEYTVHGFTFCSVTVNLDTEKMFEAFVHQPTAWGIRKISDLTDELRVSGKGSHCP